VIAGRYRIDAVLGRGGFATVFKATNLPMDQTVGG
jgi:serine/threonine protein kinase